MQTYIPKNKKRKIWGVLGFLTIAKKKTLDRWVNV